MSYSDMMAALLLIFVLVLTYSLYQYFTMLESKTRELDEQRLKLRGEGLFRVYDPTGAFLGMGEWRDGNLYPKKLLVD